MKTSLTRLALLPFLLLLGTACAEDPAADKPQAEVTEPAAETPAAATATTSVTYHITPENSEISWEGSKVTGSHTGGFDQFHGTADTDGTPEGTSVDIEIDTTSITSDTERLTDHLKSEDFFEVETYPTATFVSSSIAPGEDGKYKVTGNLTLHGVTKQISFPADIEVTESGVSAQAEFAIKRFDFDISYKGKADDLIRDDVVIMLDVNADEDMGGAMDGDMDAEGEMDGDEMDAEGEMSEDGEMEESGA